ncbi:hypothetical protein [uncultured Pantoea sp.]|uniref:hypothetical protein n=1 Tax=unclassified Pantoea TaxID=2630326 RepID=UPI0025E39670|nr:hypothetical protein [uncultured Pantoea sp.]
MRQHSDQPEVALSAATHKKGLTLISVLVIALIAGVVAIMMILDHRNAVNNALETGQCLAEEGAEGFLEMLRHFLHHAYRWIFKACG